MKVVLINTAEKHGGAAIACHRLMKALNKSGEVYACMLVRDKQSKDKNVKGVSSSLLSRWTNFIRFSWERFVIFFWNGFSRKNLFSVSLANTGTDLSSHPLVKEADVIHLHWINQGMLSLKNIRELIDMGKPIVWTLHDMWAFTGICHYSGTCQKFRETCRSCYFLRFPSDKDLSFKTFVKKKNVYKEGKIKFVTCSNWLEKTAKESHLLSDQKIVSIPNPIDVNMFIPLEKEACRKKFNLPGDKKLLLFGSMSLADKRKGFSYLVEALQFLLKKEPDLRNKVEVIVFGAANSNLSGLLNLHVHSMDFIKDTPTMVQLYNTADIYIIPSLEDNLPNTVMEAMACGVPCVGFNTGGIPEMIDHKENGYIAGYKSVQDLANGLIWCLKEADLTALSGNAREKVLRNYREEIISDRYSTLYKELMPTSHGK